MNEESERIKDKGEKTAHNVRSILGVILRILLIIVAGGVIGAVIYFSAVGWIPYIEHRFFEPIDNNQTQITALYGTQAALENQLASSGAGLSEGQVPSLENLKATLEALEQNTALLREDLARLETEIKIISAQSFTQVPARLSTLTAKQQDSDVHLSALATAQMAYLGSDFEIDLIQLIALLSRANQYLLHDNFGLAEDQLVAARQILLDIEEMQIGWHHVQVLELLSLIEGALADLPYQPELASLKLELAWHLILQDLQTHPMQSQQGTPTPIFGITPTPTSIP